MPFSLQMANIGSETFRIFKALSEGNETRAESAFRRFQELADLTIRYGRKDGTPSERSAMWKEVCRFRELYCDAFLRRDMEELAAANKYLDQFAKIKTSPKN